MLKRLLILFLLTIALPGDGFAQGLTVRDFYVRELREDGYETVRVFRTFLGRLRFVGTQPGRQREIVVNPKNGAILRDHVRLYGDGGTTKPGYSSGGSYEDDDDYDDYDDDKDDDDSDNSGSGSSNSGSGSSSSGSGSSGSDSDDDDD